MTSLISSVGWVPRGAANPHPRKYALDEAELERVGKLAGERLEEVRKDLEEAEGDYQEGEAAAEDADWEDESDGASADEDGEKDVEMADGDAPPKDPNDLSAYKLDEYDNETSKGTAMGAFSNIKGLQYYKNPSDDPYVTMKDAADDDDDEREELEIYATDNLLVAAKTEDDVSQLEVYVYDQSQENLYVHHDLLLPAMPLCLEWLDFTPAGIASSDSGRKGNFVAVGTMDPEIEIWSLDVVDGLYPDAILGAGKGQAAEEMAETSSAASPPPPESGKKKKKKKKKTPAGPLTALTHHTSSVLALSHNRQVRNLLLSASADTTIKLWDLNQPPTAPSSTFSAVRSFDLHGDKVQAVQWNAKEPSVALSGGWDGCVRVWDTRTPAEGVGVQVSADVECVRWDPWETFTFLVALDNGNVQAYDSRTLSRATPGKSQTPPKGKALWTLAAHDSSVAALEVNPGLPGCVVTGGVDKMVKIWNVEEKDGKRALSMVVSRDLGVGKVFSASFCPDDPTTLAVAGSKASLQLWDISSNAGVRAVFGDRLKERGIDVGSRERTGDGTLGLPNDVETDEEDDD